MKNVNKQIESLHLQASNIASTEVIRIARKILKENPHLNEFVMGMGSWFFSESDFAVTGQDRTTFKELDDFINTWDNELHITGEPMRFTATGNIVRDW